MQIAARIFLVFVFILCLLWAVIMDVKTCRVYNLIWWIAGSCDVLLWLLDEGRTAECLPELIGFWVLQVYLFSRMYGKADSYAFCVCAGFTYSYGFGMRQWLLHMLLALVFMTPVQAIRRNINSRGNLKKPVAFIPYIVLAFWALLWYHNRC